MKKIFVILSVVNLAVGAVLCAVILKDMKISVFEAAIGLVWLLAVNALALAIRRVVKRSSVKNCAAPSFAILRRNIATDPEPYKPAA
ncbi:MAG: hypothetical protein IJM45_04285 [Clostridia bacterium]|nr:hypothetical protein [Clostridia bacterium]